MKTPYADPAPDGSDLDPTTSHLLDLSHSTRTYKALLSGGHYNPSTSSVNVIDSALPTLSANALWDALISPEAGGEENAVRVAKGNAAFVMVEMIEGLVKVGRGAEVKKVLGSSSVRERIVAGGRKGAAMLAEKLAVL